MRSSVAQVFSLLGESAEHADPGLGASVATPPAWLIVSGWVVGIVALALLWAASRR